MTKAQITNEQIEIARLRARFGLVFLATLSLVVAVPFMPADWLHYTPLVLVVWLVACGWAGADSCR
jgi:hypothetical protein